MSSILAGATWQEITSNLPEFGNVNTVRQDPRNPDLLYVGTELGFFVSADEGGEWHSFMNDLPVVRIDDVLVHPRDNDLVLATHGRSVYVMDDVTALQQATADVRAGEVHLFEPREAVQWTLDRRRQRSVTGDKNWTGDSAPEGTAISYWLTDAEQDVEIIISDVVTGEAFRTLEGTGEAGMNRVQWDLRGEPEEEEDDGDDGPLAEPGIYRVTLQAGGEQHTTTVRVLEDVWLNR